MDLPEPLFRAIEAGTLAFRYRGVPCWKNPIDLAIMSRLLWEVKPRTVIEVGSGEGGSALWMRDQMRSYGMSCVVHSVDIRGPTNLTSHDLVFHRGDARSDLDALFNGGAFAHPLLVVEDADHQPETTTAVLNFFDHWSRPGEYVVVEDGDADRYYPGQYRGGPARAIREFLERRAGDYEVDRGYCDMFGLTFYPDGYIRRVR